MKWYENQTMQRETLRTGTPGREIIVERDGGLLRIRIQQLGEERGRLLLEDSEARLVAKTIRQHFPVGEEFCFETKLWLVISAVLNVGLIWALLWLH